MFGQNRWNSFDDVFNFQRDVDRAFKQFWNELPARSATVSPASFQVTTIEDGWRIDVPMPGVDPNDVTIEVAGNNLTIRADAAGKAADYPTASGYEQTLVIPQFLDLEKLSASNRHGMLQLTLPLKESVKPRRVHIATETEDRKQRASQ